VKVTGRVSPGASEMRLKATSSLTGRGRLAYSSRAYICNGWNVGGEPAFLTSRLMLTLAPGHTRSGSIRRLAYSNRV